jgi:hypothetical protein
LTNWAPKYIEGGTIGKIIDSYLKGKIAPDCFKVYVEVRESCVRDQVNQQSTMNDVMEKLKFALQRQENTDAMKEKISPDGGHSYTEVLSFNVAGTDIGVPRNNNVYSRHMLGTDSGTGLTTSTNIGLTCRSSDSNINSQDVSTDTGIS